MCSQLSYSALVTHAPNLFLSLSLSPSLSLSHSLSLSCGVKVVSFAVSVPIMFWSDGAQWNAFWALVRAKPEVGVNVALSGLMFYLYDELATMTVTH